MSPACPVILDAQAASTTNGFVLGPHSGNSTEVVLTEVGLGESS